MNEKYEKMLKVEFYAHFLMKMMKMLKVLLLRAEFAYGFKYKILNGSRNKILKN